jgi:NADP-dependent 3-hydroxy acid dehydrogenase YdfG
MKNHTLELRGKVAFVTGAGSGIGLGQAKVLAEEAGMKVALVDLQEKRLDEAMAYFRAKPVEVLPIPLDITDRRTYASAADQVEKRLGPVQLLMNTAGVSQRGPIETASYADWDWMMDVNLNGIINGIQTFLPRMIKHGRGGHIVNTASLSSFFCFPTATIYTTTKFAVRGLSEALRVDLAQHNIGVSMLCPGAVNTNIMAAPESRADRYGASGFQQVQKDPQTVAYMKNLLAAGYDPVDLARLTLESVKRNDFWIVPYPDYVPQFERNSKEIIDAMNSFRGDPEYVRRLTQSEAQNQKS